MSDNIADWDAIVHKNVRSSDRIAAGNVIDIEADTIVLQIGPTAQYVVPKSAVEGFNGAEVILSIAFNELGPYRKK